MSHLHIKFSTSISRQHETSNLHLYHNLKLLFFLSIIIIKTKIITLTIISLDFRLLTLLLCKISH